MMPNPMVQRASRIAHILVIGKIWMPSVTAAYQYHLSDYDLENIGQWDREHVEDWLGTHAGDFQSIEDFQAQVGNDIIAWADPDSEFVWSDCMYPPEE